MAVLVFKQHAHELKKDTDTNYYGTKDTDTPIMERFSRFSLSYLILG